MEGGEVRSDLQPLPGKRAKSRTRFPVSEPLNRQFSRSLHLNFLVYYIKSSLSPLLERHLSCK